MPEIALAGLRLPATVRPAVPVGDDALMMFSRRNRTYRIERNAQGELEVMVLSADAAWVSAARWNSLIKAEQSSFPPLCPEFLIEVLSASDSRATLERKMLVWIENGAQLAWMIDPYAATLSIYWSGVEAKVLDRPASVEAGEPVAGFRRSTLLRWDECTLGSAGTASPAARSSRASARDRSSLAEL